MSARSLWLFGLLSLLLWPTHPVRAQATDYVGTYFQARRALTQPPLGMDVLPGAQQNPAGYRGRVFEISGTVSGLVSVGDQRTVLLAVNGGSLTAWLPESWGDGRWLDSGLAVRALLRVERDGNDLSLSNLRLLAAAPEHEVSAAERRLVAMTPPRPSSLPTRGLSYGQQRGQAETVAGVSAPQVTAAAPAGLSPRAQAIYGPYWNTVRKLNRRLSTADVGKITFSILHFSDLYDIDPRLVVAMVIAESDFDIHSTSRAGAMGLGQIMPDEARRLGVSNPYDPVQNIAAAVNILRGHLDKYGGAPSNAGLIPIRQIALTMAAYNAGPGAVRKYHGVPPYRETQKYVARVTALYKRMLPANERAALQ